MSVQIDEKEKAEIIAATQTIVKSKAEGAYYQNCIVQPLHYEIIFGQVTRFDATVLSSALKKGGFIQHTILHEHGDSNRGCFLHIRVERSKGVPKPIAPPRTVEIRTLVLFALLCLALWLVHKLAMRFVDPYKDLYNEVSVLLSTIRLFKKN
jgi:hypothetical protein